MAPVVVYRGQNNIENLPKPTKPNYGNPINILLKQRGIKKVQKSKQLIPGLSLFTYFYHRTENKIFSYEKGRFFYFAVCVDE